MTEEKYGDSYGEKFRQYEDKVKELQAQIEEMKCPQNCKNGSVYNWSDNCRSREISSGPHIAFQDCFQ